MSDCSDCQNRQTTFGSLLVFISHGNISTLFHCGIKLFNYCFRHCFCFIQAQTLPYSLSFTVHWKLRNKKSSRLAAFFLSLTIACVLSIKYSECNLPWQECPFSVRLHWCHTLLYSREYYKTYEAHPSCSCCCTFHNHFLLLNVFCGPN